MKTILRAFLLFTFFIWFGGIAIATPTLFVAVAVAQVMCPGANTGSINISPGGGTGPYTYIWSNDSTTQNLSNLGVGTYSVIITDALGNKDTTTVTITAPTTFSVSKTITDEPCGGYTVGAVQINVSGGTPGYTYQWSNGDTSQNIANLTAAVYYFTITDANGCTTIDSANVTQPPGVVIASSVTDASCEMPNGSINITAEYGASGYTYAWNDGPTTQNRTGLYQGDYTITVTDTIGCTASASQVVGETPSSMSINYSTAEPTCNGGSNGSILISSVVGSTGPYTFLWNDSSTLQNRTNIASNTYIVTATSSTGCAVTDTINLGQPTAMNVSLVEVPYTCFGSDNGAINTTVTNGTTPYSYNWGGGVTTKNRIGLTIGNYTITITDLTGCTIAATTTVTQPAVLAADPVATSVSCAGGNTGSITTTTTGGTSAYSYWWGAGVTSQDRSNLNAGVYTVTVTDAHGCTASAITTVATYTPMTVSVAQTNSLCFGANGGSLGLTVTNGNSPYSYLWSNGDTTQSIDSLAEGIYTVTVSDNSLCTVSKTYTITQPAFDITINTLLTDVSCHGDNNGSITTNPTNGSSPYTYNWGGGITSQNRSNLAPGTYTLTVTDHNGCTAATSLLITQPTTITITLADSNIACFGGSTGSIDLSATGSYPPYSFLWTGGSTKQNNTLLSAGTYTVTVTDNHGCTGTATTTLTQPTNATLTTTVTNATCNGYNNGAVNLSVSGGTNPYTYNWGGGIISQNYTNITAGNYTVTVTDNAGCTYTASATVTQPTAISAVATVTNNVCNGSNTGAINLSIGGGTSPYTFNWGGGITSQNRTNLIAGNYTVTVTDSNSCSALTTATITQPAAITITMTPGNASCFGQASGGITTNITGGTGGYIYNWSNSVTSPNLTNVIAGSYTLTITDTHGCTASNTASVGQPAPVTATLSAVNAVCNGTATGGITNINTGGTGAYTYMWNNSATSQNLSNVITGTYSVTVKDANQCSVTASANISQPSAISINATVNNVSCNGGNNGSINTTLSGGNGGYIYNWSNSAATGNINNLATGNYTVTVKDDLNCSGVYSTAITQPAIINITPTTVNSSCNGGNTGSITLNVAGGVSPYSFNWGGGITSQNRTNLAAGNYQVTVTDTNGCTMLGSATITQSGGLNAMATTANATCFGQSSGSISLSVSGGSGVYTYLWSNNSALENLNNIPAGNYSVTVTDANSCSATAAGTVSQPSQIISTGFVTNATCNGSANGGVVLTVNGGAGGFTYKWSNNSTGQNLQNVDAGNYSITITDANSCTATNSFTVTQPGVIVINTSENNINCFGGNNGSITTVVNGGSGNYTYNWSNNANTSGINNLLAGPYSVTVKDAANCSATGSANITQPANLTSSTSATNVLCNGGNNGSVVLTVTGGTQPYTYQWNNNGSTPQINNLIANIYNVTITDAHSCTTTATSTVTQPTAITLSESHSDYACATQGGSITLTISGGVGPYAYNWGDGATNSHRNGLAAGNYIVTVTDANGCSISGSVVVNQLPPINAVLNTQDVTCYNRNNGSIHTIVTGGTFPYRFLWSNSDTTQNITKLNAGVYDLQITDSNLCIITSSATINQPDSILITTTVTPVSCNNESNGAITTIVSGGMPAYNYAWSNLSTSPGISNIPVGTYSLTVTDNENCKVTLNSIVVTQPAPLSASANATAIGCSSKNSGDIDLTVSGGNPPYSYNWSNQDNTQNISGLSAGAYSVTITDSKSCTTNATSTITASSPISLTSAIQNASCIGVDNGSIDLNVSGGTPSFNYAWSDGENTADLTNAAPGNYSVTITDAGGCSIVSSFMVNTNYVLTVSATGSTSINGGQSATITATANVNHNNVYTWSPAEYVTCSTCSTTQASPPQTTDFTISVVDDNGCKATDNITINVNTQVNVFVPNAFSPNGDGHNDYFQIFGNFGSIVYLDIAVFDRWGEKVYESQEPEFKWDGIYKGEPAPMGVYVYIMTISFADGSHQDYKGSVTLIK